MSENLASTESQQVRASKKSTRTKWLTGCSAVLLLICVCTAVAVGLYVNSAGDLETLTATHSIPDSVLKGDRFEFILTLINIRDSDITLSHIDLDQVVGGSILEGSAFISSDPPADRYFLGSEYKYFVYHFTIPSVESRQVTFVLEATRSGEYGGPIGVFVGNKGKQINDVTITITEK